MVVISLNVNSLTRGALLPQKIVVMDFTFVCLILHFIWNFNVDILKRYLNTLLLLTTLFLNLDSRSSSLSSFVVTSCSDNKTKSPLPNVRPLVMDLQLQIRRGHLSMACGSTAINNNHLHHSLLHGHTNLIYRFISFKTFTTVEGG